MLAALLTGLLVIGTATSKAQSPVKQVLILQSLDRGNLILDHFTADFRVSLDQRVGKPVNVVQVVVGDKGLVGPPDEAVIDYIRSMYTNRPPPDLIVTTGGPSAVFARKHRREIFPRTPLLLASLDQRFLGSAPLGANESAVTVVNDFPRLIDDVLRVLPDTRQVFMVTGSGGIGRFWRQELGAEFARFRDRVTFLWSDELSLPEILHRVANLPAHTAIVFLSFSFDAQGGSYADERVLSDIHRKANAPLFGAYTPWFGYGMVGGSMLSLDDLVRNTAGVASRILNGESPVGLKLPPLLVGQPIFDWRELQRWGISESRLPPGSIVKYRRRTLWEDHKLPILITISALVLQSFLIVLLLFERRARQRAEVESRRNLALAADANRRETVSALTSSIGHELGQPLSAILHNAYALQMVLTSDRSTRGAAEQIVTDIKAAAALAGQIIERHRTMLRSHQLHRDPIDVHSVIDDTIALVAHDMRARQIETTLELSAIPCVIEGDHVLLQQVLVNLVRNAVDALAESSSARRQITIRSAVRGADVEISVRDNGTGLPEEIIGSLFTPFVTTKSHGLGIGLTIAQRIVEAHDGTIVANENVDGGATFTVMLPRSAESGNSRDDRARAPEAPYSSLENRPVNDMGLR